MTRKVFITKTLFGSATDTDTRYLCITDEDGRPTERPVSTFNADRHVWTDEDETELRWAAELLIREIEQPD